MSDGNPRYWGTDATPRYWKGAPEAPAGPLPVSEEVFQHLQSIATHVAQTSLICRRLMDVEYTGEAVPMAPPAAPPKTTRVATDITMLSFQPDAGTLLSVEFDVSLLDLAFLERGGPHPSLQDLTSAARKLAVLEDQTVLQAVLQALAENERQFTPDDPKADRASVPHMMAVNLRESRYLSPLAAIVAVGKDPHSEWVTIEQDQRLRQLFEAGVYFVESLVSPKDSAEHKALVMDTGPHNARVRIGLNHELEWLRQEDQKTDGKKDDKEGPYQRFRLTVSLVPVIHNLDAFLVW